MSLLTIKERQTYLKELGLYTGKIDGIEGMLTKTAYKLLQNKYFTRTKDKDGVYGTNTDILLRSAYNFRDIKNFKITEFTCKCGGKYCTGYPAVINRNLLLNADKMRKNFGKAIKVNSGLRCSTWNIKQGGVSSSRHTSGKAFDLTISGITDTLSGRKKIINYWLTLNKSRYSYCNGFGKTKNTTSYPTSSTMGSAVHCDIE